MSAFCWIVTRTDHSFQIFEGWTFCTENAVGTQQMSQNRLPRLQVITMLQHLLITQARMKKTKHDNFEKIIRIHKKNQKFDT